MAYIDSSNIGVFPLSKNRTADAPINSRLFYENNASNIIRQLINTQGFVISDTVNFDGSSFISDFEFNLYGYYFNIQSGSRIIDFIAQNEVYATLTLSGNPPEIDGQDDDDQYKGISFVASNPGSGIYLHILTKENSTWKIPEDSKIKFNLSGIGISAIDGKV